MSVRRHHPSCVGDAVADRVGDLLHVVPVSEVVGIAKITGGRPQRVGDAAITLSTGAVAGSAPVLAVQLTSLLDGRGVPTITCRTLSNRRRRFTRTRIQAAHDDGRQRDMCSSQIRAPSGMTASLGTTTMPSRMW
jgi:hypothetical protein